MVGMLYNLSKVLTFGVKMKIEQTLVTKIILLPSFNKFKLERKYFTKFWTKISFDDAGYS